MYTRRIIVEFFTLIAVLACPFVALGITLESAEVVGSGPQAMAARITEAAPAPMGEGLYQSESHSQTIDFRGSLFVLVARTERKEWPADPSSLAFRCPRNQSGDPSLHLLYCTWLT